MSRRRSARFLALRVRSAEATGNGWYTYVPFPGGRGGYIVPTAGRTLLVRLADGQGYAKVNFHELLPGLPDPSSITDQSQDRYYSFTFVTNPDGFVLRGRGEHVAAAPLRPSPLSPLRHCVGAGFFVVRPRGRRIAKGEAQ